MNTANENSVQMFAYIYVQYLSPYYCSDEEQIGEVLKVF